LGSLEVVKFILPLLKNPSLNLVKHSILNSQGIETDIKARAVLTVKTGRINDLLFDYPWDIPIYYAPSNVEIVILTALTLDGLNANILNLVWSSDDPKNIYCNFVRWTIRLLYTSIKKHPLNLPFKSQLDRIICIVEYYTNDFSKIPLTFFSIQNANISNKLFSTFKGKKYCLDPEDFLILAGFCTQVFKQYLPKQFDLLNYVYNQSALNSWVIDYNTIYQKFENSNRVQNIISSINSAIISRCLSKLYDNKVYDVIYMHSTFMIHPNNVAILKAAYAASFSEIIQETISNFKLRNIHWKTGTLDLKLIKGANNLLSLII